MGEDGPDDNLTDARRLDLLLATAIADLAAVQQAQNRALIELALGEKTAKSRIAALPTKSDEVINALKNVLAELGRLGGVETDDG